MRRIVFLSVLALFCAAFPSAGFADVTGETTLHLRSGTGAAMSGASVRVYQLLFEPPSRYTPPLIAAGTADENGTFSFDVTGDEPEINAYVLAVDASKRWLVDWHMILSTQEPSEHQVRANVDLQVAAPGRSSEPPETFISITNAECVAEGDPDGRDPSLPKTQKDPDGPEDSQQGDPPQSLEDCITITDQGHVEKVDETKRWTKIMNHHSAPGMKSTFTMGTGRDTTVQVAFKSGDSNWEAGGFLQESSERSGSRSKTKYGRFHRLWWAQYVEYKWLYWDCSTGYCYYHRSWEPHHWTFGLRRSRDLLYQPRRQSDNDIVLGVNDTIEKVTADNIRYGGGMSLVGLKLDAQTGYSRISKMSWTGTKRGCKKWLFGEHTDPYEAREVNATSTC